MATIVDADADLDRQRATDLVVVPSHPHVAKRVRCCDWRDVTVRVPGEESKLEAGYVNHYVFGWAETAMTSTSPPGCCSASGRSSTPGSCAARGRSPTATG